MKSISTFTALFLIGTLSMACPDFTGTWTCDNNGVRSLMRLSSETRFGVERLVQTNDYQTLFAQSQIYLLDIGPQTMGQTVQSGTCDGNNITMNVKEYLNSRKDKLVDVTYRFVKYNDNSFIIDVISSNDPLIDPDLAVISCKRSAL
jgi:hypothetical protein